MTLPQHHCTECGQGHCPLRSCCPACKNRTPAAVTRKAERDLERMEAFRNRLYHPTEETDNAAPIS